MLSNAVLAIVFLHANRRHVVLGRDLSPRIRLGRKSRDLDRVPQNSAFSALARRHDEHELRLVAILDSGVKNDLRLPRPDAKGVRGTPGIGLDPNEREEKARGFDFGGLVRVKLERLPESGLGPRNRRHSQEKG